MVKIVEIAEMENFEEFALKNVKDGFVCFAREGYYSSTVIRRVGTGIVFIDNMVNSLIVAIVDNNKIRLYDKGALDYVKKLAESYEEYSGNEVTLTVLNKVSSS